MKSTVNNKQAFYQGIFQAAAFYNLIAGIAIILYPNWLFHFCKIQPINYPFIMQGVGMMVAVYGYAYWVVSKNLIKYKDLAFVGFLGKLFGAIGWIYYTSTSEITSSSLILTFFNDIIWIFPFLAYFRWVTTYEFTQNVNGRHSLYPSILKDDFNRMPMLLRTFHTSITRSVCSGNFNVERAQGLKSVVASILNLPQAGKNIDVVLSVIPANEEETWIRRFGNKIIRTTSYRTQNYLVESVGPIEWYFKLETSEKGLNYRFYCQKLMGISLPSFLSLHVNSEVIAGTNDWVVTVNFSNPVFGFLTKYVGLVKPLSI